VFLVNSRRSRSSAALPEESAPSTEGTGPFCRVPSMAVSRRLDMLYPPTRVRLGTVRKGRSNTPWLRSLSDKRRLPERVTTVVLFLGMRAPDLSSLRTQHTTGPALRAMPFDHTAVAVVVGVGSCTETYLSVQPLGGRPAGLPCLHATHASINTPVTNPNLSVGLPYTRRSATATSGQCRRSPGISVSP